MTAITNILLALPDDAARHRVMRWSFGRFDEGFKRPAPPEPVVPPLPSPRVRPSVAAERPQPARRPLTDDFAEQFAELEEFYPPRGAREAQAADGDYRF